MKKLHQYTFTVKLLDYQSEVNLDNKIFFAENSYEAAKMLSEKLEALHLACDYQIFCNEEEL